MQAYRPRKVEQGEMTDADICAKAREKGFDRVLVLAGNGPPDKPTVTRKDCTLDR
jgi:hypothetical protein